MLGFKHVSDDQFYNRRRLSVFLLAYTVLWGVIILAVDIFAGFETSKVLAYLGIPATMAGLPMWQYLKATQEHDKLGKESDTNN